MHNYASQTQKPRLIEVKLYGDLRERFGASFKLAIQTPAEAVRALCCMLPGFTTYVSAPDRFFRVYVGNNRHTPETLHFPITGSNVRIVPVIAGAGGDGFQQVVLGAALIVASFYVPGAWTLAAGKISIATMVFNIGVAMALGGVAQLIAGSPKTPNPQERPENQPSYVFDGPVNTVEPGGPVPILYGELEIGSQVIGAGMSTTQINIPEPVVGAPPPPEPGPSGGGGEEGVDWYISNE